MNAKTSMITALMAAVGTALTGVSGMLLAWRADRRTAEKAALDNAELKLKILELERKMLDNASPVQSGTT